MYSSVWNELRELRTYIYIYMHLQKKLQLEEVYYNGSNI